MIPNVPQVKETPPASVKDVTSGIVALNQGEYVIYNLQFRVGDGDSVAKDWEALRCLETIHVPYAIWDGTSSPSSLASYLPLVQNQSSASAGASSEGKGQSLRAPFNQRAVTAHYADYIEHDEEAYVRSHFGDERTDMARNADNMMAMMGEMLLGSVAQAGNTDLLAQRLRDMGMDELAGKVAARGP